MKVDTETLGRMRAAIAPLDTAERRERYRTGQFPRAEDVRNLDMRYRWDLFWSAGLGRLYTERPDIADAHIDTALRHIVPALETPHA